ncbi:MAG: hypothetical protein Q8922_02595 [Bacteroidota bacterium]|nr:hypothetical protein [Bacteroidota bacterium]MDP4234745.1 hypothetical protein [Bacteroidota bacterium]MDP4242637.1 hypothetical protein [Bacteroidota bacterium]MDP4286801.1 hypothetical protein [Bacteroidota bacterium]
MKFSICYIGLVLVLLAPIAQDQARAQFLGQQSLSQSSYVIDKNGRLFTFGWNAYGQLGVGDRTDHYTPVEVPIPAGASHWTFVAGGAEHALALADSDKLFAWGSNRYGQLGTGTLGEVVIPTRVQNPPGVTAWKWVTAGRDHSLALSSTGQLYAWGNNDDGQLGTGNRYLSKTPVPVLSEGVNVWTQVAAGPGYTLAVAANGLMFGWGTDSMGNCQSTTPRRVSSTLHRFDSPLLALSGSYERQSSVLASGHYGNGAGEDPLNPPPPLQPQIASDADGGFHSLIIQADGILRSIGANEHGQLGIGDTLIHLRPHQTPIGSYVTQPQGVTQFVAVSAGLYHSLALGNDGNLYVWGDNRFGELGLGADSLRRTWPARLMTIGDSIRIRATLTNPLSYEGIPITATLTCTNIASATPLRPTGLIVPCTDVSILDSLRMKALAPAPLPLGLTDTATWMLKGVQHIYTGSEYYFVYVQTSGSAPYFLVNNFNALPPPFDATISAYVVDSLTGLGLSGGMCVVPGLGAFPHDIVPIDNNARFSAHFTVYNQFGYLAYIARENYRSTYFRMIPPADGDTIPTIEMGPAPVQGLFSNISEIDPSSGITKLYYPDSLVGFAIGRNIIWRTTDSGGHWNPIFVGPSDKYLNDIRFANPLAGIAVGELGEILATTNGGKTWTEENAGITQTLRAIAFSHRDTAWAIGDGGVVLKRSLDSSGHAFWTALPSLGNMTLNAIHFFDAMHGAIVGFDSYFLYDGSAWQLYNPQFVTGDLRAVYYTSPDHLFVGGVQGIIGDVFGTLHTPQMTLSKQTITGLYFLNTDIGFATGDSARSFVTYDGGLTWAPLEEVSGNASSISFYGVNGHLLNGKQPMNFTGQANPIAGIVKGHVVTHDHQTGIRGAMVIRTLTRYSIPNYTWWIDTAWTNELGNFVFAAIKDTVHYTYVLNYTDSGMAKTFVWQDISVHKGEIVTLSFADSEVVAPPPPPPPPPASAGQFDAASGLTLWVEGVDEGALHVEYNLPTEETSELAVFDLMGRELQVFEGLSRGAGRHDALMPISDMANGVYYLRLRTPTGVKTIGFTLTK